MEELHQAVVAYYNKSSPEVHQLALDFFMVMDSNGDGRVNHWEFEEFLHHIGYGRLRGFFNELDRNRDGSLDFWEVLTLYYMVKTRYLVYRNCSASLKGLYITCVPCFDRASPTTPTFDLCTHCYGHVPFSHPHTHFLDSYTFLTSKRGSMTVQQSTIQQPLDLSPAPPPGVRWWAAFQALDLAISVGTWATYGAALCTIM